MSARPSWFRVRDWPEKRPGRWLGLEDNQVPRVRNLFDSGLIFERLAIGPTYSALEVRIPCRRGEIYPVSAKIWAWSGTGGRWSRRVSDRCSGTATGPLGTDLHHGTRDDESVIWFPADMVEAVADEVGARRRRSTWRQPGNGPVAGAGNCDSQKNRAGT